MISLRGGLLQANAVQRLFVASDVYSMWLLLESSSGKWFGNELYTWAGLCVGKR